MENNVRNAERLMAGFASRTADSASGSGGVRYLWTDAFAVFNFLALRELAGDARYLSLALNLVDQVHQSLGRHRNDDPRSGWISGLSESDALRHPTRGGLRIGKRLPERGPGEPFDEHLEWQRDGQYFHYLTKWMHALNRVTLVTGDRKYNDWAIELAHAAHRSFVYTSAGGRRRMYWKMSVDLSRPLVTSMGQHDPLDGFVTCCQLMATRNALGENSSDLDPVLSDFHRMCAGETSPTPDELGIGGLLTDAAHLVRLTATGDIDEASIMEQVLLATVHSLHYWGARHRQDSAFTGRLAFRELGLAIGLQAVPLMRQAIVRQADRFRDPKLLVRYLDEIGQYLPLVERLQSYWLQPDSQRAAAWIDHRDINSVMLATSLVPRIFLVGDETSFAAVHHSRPATA